MHQETNVNSNFGILHLTEYKKKKNYNLKLHLDSEQSQECIGFTMKCFFFLFL